MIIQDRDSLAFQNKTFKKGHRILIAYATQTGNAKSIAQRIFALNQTHCDIVDLSALPVRLLEEYERVVFVVSTYGNGDPPSNVVSFYDALCQSEIDLNAVKYAVLALGDRQYLHFCGFGNNLSHQLIKHGAMPRVPLTEVNRNDAVIIEHWWSKLQETFGLQCEVSEDWTVATLMERVEDKDVVRFTLYIKSLEFSSAKTLIIKDSKDASKRMQVDIVSEDFDPFTSILFEEVHVKKHGSPLWRQLSSSQPGDKWHVQVCN
ncbi:MAG: flavodoxin family protein [Pseudomonadota bacterium]